PFARQFKICRTPPTRCRSRCTRPTPARRVVAAASPATARHSPMTWSKATSPRSNPLNNKSAGSLPALFDSRFSVLGALSPRDVGLFGLRLDVFGAQSVVSLAKFAEQRLALIFRQRAD